MRLKTYTLITCTFLIIQFTYSQETAQRKGFVLGTSLGVSNTNLAFPNQTYNYSDLAIDLKFGYLLNPKLALLLTSNVSVYDYTGFGRDRKRDFGVLAPAVQYWITDKLWILGGIGIGGDNPVFWDIKNPDDDSLETKYYSGFGAVASVGYELFKLKENFVIDIKVKSMYRSVELQEGNTTGFSNAIMLGINFY